MFYIPSHIDMAGCTKVFDYSDMDHWGNGPQGGQFSGARPTRTNDLFGSACQKEVPVSLTV